MTLTEAAFWTKRFGVIAVGAFVVFFVVILILLSGDKDDIAPPEYLTANYSCTETKGEFLQHRLEIPGLRLADGTEMVFEINTDSGKIDSLPQIINVYQFNNPVQSLSSQADSKIIAGKMGFNPDDIIRRGTQSYVWINRQNSMTLEIEAKNLNFTLKTDAGRIRELISEGDVPNEQNAKSLASNILRSLGLYSSDYSNGNHITTLIRVNPDGTYSKASSLSEAHLVRVDFVRNKSMITIPSNIVGAESMVQMLSRRMPMEPIIESSIVNDKRIEVYTFNTMVSFSPSNSSNITVYVGPDRTDSANSTMRSIYQIDYKYWPVAQESCGTYELITPQVAIERVQSGQGSLVYLAGIGEDDVVEYVPKRVKRFSVNDIFLLYYEDKEELEYLQPVYLVTGEAIFENDTRGTFDFYYPAINYDNVQNRVILPEAEVIEESGLGFF